MLSYKGALMKITIRIDAIVQINKIPLSFKCYNAQFLHQT
jgi:hypothetical protein